MLPRARMRSPAISSNRPKPSSFAWTASAPTFRAIALTRSPQGVKIAFVHKRGCIKVRLRLIKDVLAVLPDLSTYANIGILASPICAHLKLYVLSGVPFRQNVIRLTPSSVNSSQCDHRASSAKAFMRSQGLRVFERPDGLDVGNQGKLQAPSRRPFILDNRFYQE